MNNNVDTRTFNILSLCSGVGGLDIALKMAIENARTICYSEIEAYACAVLAARMDDGQLDAAPIWTDLKTFDSVPWRGVVDCVIGGYPCQPFSGAGKRMGKEDPRHLWPYIEKVVSLIRPSQCFFENVAGHLTLGFKEVTESLECLGYHVTAGIYSAQEVGAPHERERLYILANSDKKYGEKRLGSKCYGETPILSKSDFRSTGVWLQAPDKCVGMGNGVADRFYEDRGAACGNGVVPQCAAYAYQSLYRMYKAEKGEKEGEGDQ